MKIRRIAAPNVASVPSRAVRTAPSDVPMPPPYTLEQKIGHLGRAGSYPDYTSRVEVVETHTSVVFLTDRLAYKLKKPVRRAYLDFSTLEARRLDCLEELRLNRRLAAPVYLAVVPLVARGGSLILEGCGTAVEWLVKMRRLPREAMLDHALAAGTVDAAAIDRCMAVLCRFYLAGAPAEISAGEYRDRCARDIEASRDALAHPSYALPRAMADRVARRLLQFVARDGSLLDRRIAARRVIEGHGDLRPEHVCLAPEPLFIDCLEFDAALRTLDTADEAGYLAMECDCAGAPQVASLVLDAYRRHAQDDAPQAVLAFYQSARALVRAKLAAWHLEEAVNGAVRERWQARAGVYIRYAGERLGL